MMPDVKLKNYLLWVVLGKAKAEIIRERRQHVPRAR